MSTVIDGWTDNEKTFSHYADGVTVGTLHGRLWVRFGDEPHEVIGIPPNVFTELLRRAGWKVEAP